MAILTATAVAAHPLLWQINWRGEQESAPLHAETSSCVNQATLELAMLELCLIIGHGLPFCQNKIPAKVSRYVVIEYYPHP